MLHTTIKGPEIVKTELQLLLLDFIFILKVINYVTFHLLVLINPV